MSNSIMTLAEKERDEYKQRMNVANKQLKKMEKQLIEKNKCFEELEQKFDKHKIEAYNIVDVFKKTIAEYNIEKQNILAENAELKAKYRALKNNGCND